jgi:MFS family permease
MQSSWAVGYALAALVTAAVMPRFGWRAVFFVGVLPALVTVWIRRKVPEPEIWQKSKVQGPRSKVSGSPSTLDFGLGTWDCFRSLFARPLRRRAIVVTAMNAASMFGWWGLFTWIPGYLALPVSQGGRGLNILSTSKWILLMQAGMWLGYVSFGFLADSFGRKRTYIFYLLVAAALVPFYSLARSPGAVMLLGPFVAFFGTGYFTGFGAISSELFPTTVRGTAMGFAYNFGRGLSAMAPYAIGRLSERHGLGASFLITSAAFLAAALIALGIEETRGKRLE